MTSTQQEKLSQVVTSLRAIHLQPTSKITQIAFPLLEKDVTPGLQIGISQIPIKREQSFLNVHRPKNHFRTKLGTVRAAAVQIHKHGSCRVKNNMQIEKEKLPKNSLSLEQR